MDVMSSAGSRQKVGRLIRARLCALAVVLAIMVPLFGGAAPQVALAQTDGIYMLQCSCPVWWSEPWSGAGTFDERASRDELVLVNGPASMIMVEIPVDAGTIEGMIEDRTAELEDSRDVSGLEVTFEDETTDQAYAGRRWESPQGEVFHSIQHVQVWESNFLLSIEYAAPDDEFIELWDSLQVIELVAQPILDHLTGEQVAETIGVGEDSQSSSGGGQNSPKRSDVSPDLVEAGVIEEGFYQSPNFGYEVVWSEEWSVEPEYTTSERSYDQVQFMNEDGWVTSFGGGQLSEDMTVPDYVDYLVESEQDSGSEILLEDADDEAGGYVAIFETEDGEELIIYVTVALYDRDGTVVTSALVAPLNDFEDALDEAQDAFELDGDSVLDYFRAREIRRALGD